MGRMDLNKSLRPLSDLGVSAVNLFSKAVHRRDAKNAEVAQSKNLLSVVPFLRSSAAVLAIAIVVSLSATSNSRSQSGRQKPANANANTNSRPRQVAKPKNSNSSTNQPANTPAASKSDPEQETGEEATDVVRVSSNLVPVPATVVDSRGIALTNLKLEDFELRVDGQPNTITDISRAETPVRMAMLFDNSGSLSESRDFEKRAAVRFFQNVMRPADQAAIYSVSTTVELAQPMTNDVRRLQQTIESFGTPDAASWSSCPTGKTPPAACPNTISITPCSD